MSHLGKAYGIPRPHHALRDAARRERNQAGRIAAQYADVLGAGPAKSLADCKTKTTYSSRCVAEAAATLLTWAGKTIRLRPYECPWCTEWHLTGQGARP
jgi:hypothetical protein